MPRFFINRPIFAWVIAIMVMLIGLLAIKTLPVSTPDSAAQITINAVYPVPPPDRQIRHPGHELKLKVSQPHLHVFTSDSAGPSP